MMTSKQSIKKVKASLKSRGYDISVFLEDSQSGDEDMRVVAGLLQLLDGIKVEKEKKSKSKVQGEQIH